MMGNKVFIIEKIDILESENNFHTKAYIKEGNIVYVSCGSSSCPPLIKSVQQSGNEIYLTTKDYKGMICTADLVPVIQIVSYEDGTPIPAYTKVFLDGKQQN